MKLCRVIGTVVSSRKDPGVEGLKLYLVRELSDTLELRGAPLVAADAVGAGLGEIVLIAQGSSARQTELTTNRPVDAVVMGIVDALTIGAELRYDKSAE